MTCRRLIPQGTSFSFLHAVTQPLHSIQRSASQRNFILAMRLSPLLRRRDTAQRGLGFLHLGHEFVAVGRGRVAGLAPDIRRRALRILVIEVLALEPATEMKRCPDRPGPTRGVTMARTLIRPPSAPSSQTYCPSRIPASLASSGLISANISGCSLASQLLERVSSPPPSYSTRRPLVKTSGYLLAVIDDWIDW